MISIHAPRGGSDRAQWQSIQPHIHFNPRSPWGERLPALTEKAVLWGISIHAPRGGSDNPFFSCWSGLSISIHAPRGGSDVQFAQAISHCIISIHAPRGGSDFGLSQYVSDRDVFQSTLPVGGATSIPPLLGGLRAGISIHAPRGGSDLDGLHLCLLAQDFNPRSPWGERRGKRILRNGERTISIHAPRGGSDRTNNSGSSGSSNFNPRSPWGERPFCSGVESAVAQFQSTLPVWGATK